MPMPMPVTIDELTLADEPAAWAALGFAVHEDRCRLGAVSLRLAGAGEARGILAWSLRGAAACELDGLPTTISRSPHSAAAGAHPSAHPNGVLAIDHVVAMSPDLDRSIAALRAAGLDLRRVREQPTPAGAPRQAFFRLGREILEVIQEPADVVARAGAAERGARFWGLALLVDDLDRAAALFGGALGEIRPAVQPGRRIATVRRSAGLSVPLALISAQDREGAQGRAGADEREGAKEREGAGESGAPREPSLAGERGRRSP
jgi:catechol 2,3-dioxygenase-like lactoylglutathione lyase family enzyme